MTSENRPKSEDNPIPRVTSAGTMRGEMLYRELGATGRICFCHRNGRITSRTCNGGRGSSRFASSMKGLIVVSTFLITAGTITKAAAKSVLERHSRRRGIDGRHS